MMAAQRALIVVVMLAAACKGASPSTPEGPLGATPQTGCRNEASALFDPGLRKPAARGDVDGDGAPDEIRLVVDEGAEIGCRVFLVVGEESDRHVLAVDREAVSFDLGLPVLVAVVQVDGEPGADVVVDLLAGASTVFAGVFTLGSGELAQLRVAGARDAADDLFAHEGSVGHLDAVDCGPRGTVVVSSASPKGARYQVRRRSYEARAGVLRPNRSKDETAVVALDRLLRRFPEFATPPFTSCPES